MIKKSETVVPESEVTSYLRYCSRYESCSIPLCPLDPNIALRVRHKDEPKCNMARATRHNYWESMSGGMRKNLPFEGLTKREWTGQQAGKSRFLALSVEEQEDIRARMRVLAAYSRSKRKAPGLKIGGVGDKDQKAQKKEESVLGTSGPPISDSGSEKSPSPLEDCTEKRSIKHKEATSNEKI